MYGQTLYISGSQNVLCGSQGIDDQFARVLWIRFFNGSLEVYLFFKLRE